MKIGEIVEHFIQIRDNRNINYYTEQEDEALIEACNLLDKLPRMAEATEYKEVLSEIIPKL